MTKKFLSFLCIFSLVISAVAITATVSAADYSTFDVVLVDDGSGTVIITAAIPAGSINGKICINVSDKLTYVEGSLSNPVPGGLSNPNYDRDGVTGLCTNFATPIEFTADTVMFYAEFTVAEANIGTLTADDFTAEFWQIGSFVGGEDRDVNKTVKNIRTVTFVASEGGSLSGTTELVVELGTSFSSLTFPAFSCDDGYGFAGWLYEGDKVTEDITITADFYLIGDVNFDGRVDSSDAATVLQYDVGLVDFDADACVAGDVNFDNRTDSSDAALILQYDVGLVDGFVYPGV